MAETLQPMADSSFNGRLPSRVPSVVGRPSQAVQAWDGLGSPSHIPGAEFPRNTDRECGGSFHLPEDDLSLLN
jgi:hypothetical protein